jgi:hypothetical protein
MIGLRSNTWRRFGASLTGLALGLQLMLSSLGLVIAAASADPADAFGGHALCLSGSATSPAGDTPAPAHNHLGFCCLWHQLPGIEPVAVSVLVPLAFGYVTPSHPGLAAFTPGPRRGPANARAPPLPV